MGMSGFTIAWNRAEHVFNPGLCVSSVLLGRTLLAVMRGEICVEGH